MLSATVAAATVIKRDSNFLSGQLIKVGKLADFGHKYGKTFRKRAAHPHPFFLGVNPPGG